MDKKVMDKKKVYAIAGVILLSASALYFYNKKHTLALTGATNSNSGTTDSTASTIPENSIPSTQTNEGIKIVSANYGTDSSNIDVKSIIERNIGTQIYANNDLFTDPVPGIEKRLIVNYTNNGVMSQAVVKENGLIDLKDMAVSSANGMSYTRSLGW